MSGLFVCIMGAKFCNDFPESKEWQGMAWQPKICVHMWEKQWEQQNKPRKNSHNYLKMKGKIIWQKNNAVKVLGYMYVCNWNCAMQ